MGIKVSTAALPACWASALINGDYSSFSLDDDGGDAEEAAITAALESLAPWYVVDVARDKNGDAVEPYFSWSYNLHGGTARGGDVLDYVIHRQTRRYTRKAR